MNITSLPDFIKLVAISWIGCFSSLVAGVETAEESVWLQELPGEKKKSLLGFFYKAVMVRERAKSLRLHTYPALMAVLRSVEVDTLVLTVIMFRFIR